MIRIIYFIFLVLPAALIGQDKPEYSIALIDTALLKNASAVIRFEETRYIIQSPREYVHQTTKVVTVFDEKSDKSVVIVPYDKYSKAEVKSIFVYDAFGKLIRRIKKSELLDVAAYDGFTVFSDNRFIGIKSFGGKFPYTLEYSWVITNRETMFYPNWHPQDAEVSVESASFVLDAPEELEIRTRAFNYDFDFHQESKEGRSVKTWTLKNSKAFRPEESVLPGFEYFPAVMLAPSVFQVEDYTGSMDDWNVFGDFIYRINKDREKVTPEMRSLILEITKHSKTSREKIDTLYRWMQKNMRYVSVQLGIGGFQSFDAPYVEKNRYGDCKALSTFMKGMLQEVGIESYQAVIKWDEEESQYLDDFVILDFNHMMLFIPSENMWLECTSNYMPPGTIDQHEENKKVLLITPEGGKIITSPTSTPYDNQKFSLDSVFAEKNIIKGKRQYFGNAQRFVRYYAYHSTQEELKESFLESYPLAVKKLDAFRLIVDRNGTESNLNYAVQIPQFGNMSGNRFFIPVNSLHSPQFECKESDRKTPYYLRENLTESSETVVSIPGGYEIEYIPSKTQLDFEGNEYHLAIDVKNGFVHIHQKVIRKALKLPAERYGELCSYYRSVMKANGQMVILKKSKT